MYLLTNIHAAQGILSISTVGVPTFIVLRFLSLREIDRYMNAKDYVQASEKAWGAFAQTVKLIAAREEKRELGTHRSIGEYVIKLDKKHPSLNLKNIYAFANSLHIDFYEDNLSPDRVEYYI